MPTTGPNLTSANEMPPVMPVAATKHTAAGAKAFAEFFIQTIDWGFATINGSYIRHYATKACVSCRTLADGMDADRRAGDRYIGGRFTILESTLSRRVLAAKADLTALIDFDVLSFEQVTKAGKLAAADQAHRDEQFEVSISWRDGGWRVIKLAVNRSSRIGVVQPLSRS